MKLLFILTFYYPHWTGLTKYAQRLAEGLSENNFDVSVLTIKHQKELKDRERVNGVEIIRKPFLFRLSRTLVSFSFIFSFWENIKKADRVIVFLPFAEVLFVALICKLLGKELILIHNGDMVLPGGISNRFIEKIYFHSTSWAMSLAIRIVIYTEDYAGRSDLLLRHRDKWVVIWPLFSVGKVKKDIISSIKKKFGLEGMGVVGFAGRFVEEKGVDVLLAAIPLVVKEIPDVRFLFAGEKVLSYENFYKKNLDLIKRNEKYISFTGLIRDEDTLASFYSLCDVLVLPSRTECLGSVQVEAMMCGTPVVVTDIPGARTIVKNTGMGVIVPSEDSQQLAHGIINVLKNRGKYASRADMAVKEFNYDKTLGSYIGLFGKGN